MWYEIEGKADCSIDVVFSRSLVSGESSLYIFPSVVTSSSSLAKIVIPERLNVPSLTLDWDGNGETDTIIFPDEIRGNIPRLKKEV